MTRQPIGKGSTETPAAMRARKVDEADRHARTHPDHAETEREQAIQSAIARVIGPDEARKLMATTASAAEPRLTAYEASELRRAAAQRDGR